MATRFRIWATQTLREYVVKGFVLDDERLKNPDQPFDYFDELIRRIPMTMAGWIKKLEAFMTLNSTLSDYMIHLFQGRHSGRDCRNPGFMDGFKLTIHGTGCPLPGGHDELADNPTK